MLDKTWESYEPTSLVSAILIFCLVAVVVGLVMGQNWVGVREVTKVARELNHHLLLVYVRSIRPVDLTYRLA